MLNEITIHEKTAEYLRYRKHKLVDLQVLAFKMLLGGVDAPAHSDLDADRWIVVAYIEDGSYGRIAEFNKRVLAEGFVRVVNDLINLKIAET